MELLQYVGMGEVLDDENKTRNDAMQRTFLVVCRRGYAQQAEAVKTVIEQMWHFEEPYYDPDAVELQLKNADWGKEHGSADDPSASSTSAGANNR
ncbi:unnamed protein product [Sphacelaria rigidula]